MSRFALLAALLGCLAGITSCDGKKAPRAQEAREDQPAPKDEVSQNVEALTGARTRVVWSQHQKTKAADPYSHSESALLFALDTGDGRGARPLFSKQGNYYRPLISPDGATIVYTVKDVIKDAQGRKTYKTDIVRTDFEGTPPAPLAEGCAVDVWSDPRDGAAWVYAVRDYVPSEFISIQARQLVRFPLADPAKVEIVWDKTPISPDNIQLSRDGTRASGQFPWPHSGRLLMKPDAKESAFVKLLTGCWPSMAPDDSGVSWVLDGAHKHATVFDADGSRSWTLDLSRAPGIDGSEIYHPRWTNHPRFITLTGPYRGEKDGTSTIGKGGLTSEVYIGKLNEKLDGFEGWASLTSNALGDNYPDVWIAGGEKQSLAGFGGGASPGGAKNAWPASKQGVVFLWENRNSSNTVTLADGKLVECNLSAQGAARFGRHLDMRLDSAPPPGGAAAFIADGEAARPLETLFAATDGSGEGTVEFTVVADNATQAGAATLIRCTGLLIRLAARQVHFSSASGLDHTLELPAGGIAVHLAVRRSMGRDEVLLNGAPVRTTIGPVARPPAVVPAGFGGGSWQGGLMGLAFYHRALADGELAANAQTMLARAESRPAPPRIKLRGKLVETSAIPTPEAIYPYTGALVSYVYEVKTVAAGEFKATRILVKHWGMLGRKVVTGFPRKIGEEYDLEVEPEAGHPQLKGERIVDDTTALDLEAHYDVSVPGV